MDIYIPSHLLNNFVVKYESARRYKVEKEFHADFKSSSQMVHCVVQFEIEQQFQSVYTISKFREAQEEFIRKAYYDVILISNGCLGTTYEVQEVVTNDGRRKNTLGIICV